MNMRVLVTGATGFLGGALTRALLAEGRDVIALGRDAGKLEALKRAGAAIVSRDLADDGALAPACDAVVHCAALSTPWGRLADFARANIEGTRGAISLARGSGARRFVHISTPSLYFRFEDQIGIREDAPLTRGVNAYARTKRVAEDIVRTAKDLDPIILRPRGLYGPGDTTLLPRLIAAARKRALPLMRGGRAATDLTYIDDVVAAARAAINTPSLSHNVFNVSGGVALNVRQVAERAATRAGVNVRWRTVPTHAVLAYARAAEWISGVLPARPEPPITAYGAGLFAFTQTLDISAARKFLRWTPRVSFDEGLDRTFVSAAA